MKVTVKIIVLMFIVPLFAQAQSVKDSIYLLNHYKKVYHQNYLKHNLTSPQNFGEVELGYFSTSGDGKLSQEAQDSRNIDFCAIGANQLGDFRVSGDFLFNKVFEDSLSFGQRNNIDQWSPFNYYASKAGNYERQNYKANLTLSYNIKRKIQPFFNVNYLSHWTTGSVDPRFESKKFEMKYNPGLIVNFEDFNVSAKAIFGKGRENLGVTYKNREFSTSLLYPERIHFLNLGYGYTSIKDTVNTRKYTDIKGAEVAFNTSFGRNTFDLSASFERKEDDNTNDLKSAKTYRVRGEYTEDTYVINAILNLNRGSAKHLIIGNGTYINGIDGLINFSPSLDKVNYAIEYYEADLSYLYSSVSNRNWNLDFGMDVKYSSIDRKDYASNLSVTNEFVEISPMIYLRKKIFELDYLQLTVQSKFVFDVNHSIKYSSNSINNYIRNVIFWDYDYYRTNGSTLNVGLNWWTKRISSQYLLGIKANYSHHKTIDTLKDPVYSGYPDSWNRDMYSVAVTLSL